MAVGNVNPNPTHMISLLLTQMFVIGSICHRAALLYSGCHPMDYETKISQPGPKRRLLGMLHPLLVQYHLKQCGCLQFECIHIFMNVETIKLT